MQQEVLRYRFFKDQLARLVARLMLYKATGYNTDLFYSWQHLSNKKPVIPQWKHFNITHSGNYVVLAMCELAPIGIDIEEIKPTTNVLELANSFRPEEKALVLNATNPNAVFFDLWTKKEALLKGLGDGLLKEGLKLFDCRANDIVVDYQTWYFNEIIIASNYKCHLATPANITPIVVTPLVPESLLVIA